MSYTKFIALAFVVLLAAPAAAMYNYAGSFPPANGYSYNTYQYGNQPVHQQYYCNNVQYGFGCNSAPSQYQAQQDFDSDYYSSYYGQYYNSGYQTGYPIYYTVPQGYSYYYSASVPTWPNAYNTGIMPNYWYYG